MKWSVTNSRYAGIEDMCKKGNWRRLHSVLLLGPLMQIIDSKKEKPQYLQQVSLNVIDFVKQITTKRSAIKYIVAIAEKFAGTLDEEEMAAIDDELLAVFGGEKQSKEEEGGSSDTVQKSGMQRSDNVITDHNVRHMERL